MFLSVRPLTDVTNWARGSGLEIVLLVTGAMLLTRFVTWLGARITDRIDAHAQETDALVRSEAAKHRHALAQVITWATLVIIYCAAGVAVVARLGVPVTSLVGTVEDVTLRVTTVRTADGEVVITPNGQISQVTNLSRDWARAVVDVPVPAAVDVNRVSELLRQVGEEAHREPELRRLLLDRPAVMGVQSIGVDHFQVRMVARTLPGKQFDVGRILRARIAAGLGREGINLPAGLDTAAPTGTE